NSTEEGKLICTTISLAASSPSFFNTTLYSAGRPTVIRRGPRVSTENKGLFRANKTPFSVPAVFAAGFSDGGAGVGALAGKGCFGSSGSEGESGKSASSSTSIGASISSTAELRGRRPTGSAGGSSSSGSSSWAVARRLEGLGDKTARPLPVRAVDGGAAA